MVRSVAPLVLLAATIIDVIATAGRPRTAGFEPAWWGFSGLVLAAWLLQHLWPASVAGVLIQFTMLGSLTPLDLAVPVTLFALAAQAQTRWTAIAGLGCVLAGALVCVLTTRPTLYALVPMPAILVAAFALGEAARVRRVRRVRRFS